MRVTVEDAVQWVWRTKHELVNNWKASARRKNLWNALQEIYLEKYLETGSVSGTESQIQESIQSKEDAPPPRGGGIPITTTPEGSVKTHTFRDAAGALLGNQSVFTVSSGVLLWGQVIPMYYGSLQEEFTNSAAVYTNMYSRDTTKQYIYTHRSAARNGRWKSRRYYSNWRGHDGQDRPPRDHAGWIICHEDVDATEILKRLEALNPSGTAIRGKNEHIDKVNTRNMRDTHVKRRR